MSTHWHAHAQYEVTFAAHPASATRLLPRSHVVPLRWVVRLASVFAWLFASVPSASAQSAFSHQIPIKLPIGTNGMQPDLALTYSPGGGNGIIGIGWQLVGFPSITRVNYGNGINYGGGDAYAHSQAGILIPQPDGSYRSKAESFIKFVPSGRCGGTNEWCSWTAYYPSGRVAYYGTTADSQVLVQGRQNVRTWGLAKIADVFDNSYQVAYNADLSNGQFYPREVKYTIAANLTTCRTVQFSYEGRTDTDPRYDQGAFQQTTQRLKTISVNAGANCLTSSGGALVRKYRLDYECGSAPACTNSETGRSRLVAVTEIGSDGTSELPAQRFTWQGGGGPQDPSSLYKTPGTDYVALFSGHDADTPNGWDYGLRIVDFNGDGRPDLLKGHYNWGNYDLKAWRNTPNGWVEMPSYAPPVPFTGRGYSSGAGWDAGVRVVDLNGDGKPDLIEGSSNYGAPPNCCFPRSLTASSSRSATGLS